MEYLEASTSRHFVFEKKEKKKELKYGMTWGDWKRSFKNRLVS